MNLDQLRYVHAIYETGSIRRAADKLFLSQPNVSSAVSKLEKELGFTILVRHHNGVQFTEKGLELVQTATRILEECNSIKGLCSRPALEHFRIVTTPYPPVSRAFIHLCGELEKSGQLQEQDLRLTNGNWIESLTALYKGNAELAVTSIPEETVTSALFLNSLQQHGAVFTPLVKTSVVVKLAKDHPLLQQTPFPFEKLNDYPMTEYNSTVDTLSAYGGIQLPLSFNPSRIYVSSGRTRSQLIAQTNAWGVAVKLPKAHEEEYGIRYVEIPQSSWCIGYLKAVHSPTSHLEERFLSLLKEELSFLEE